MTTDAHADSLGSAQLRLLSVIARLYHVQEVRQRDIAERLGMSQARVSRLLRQAQDVGLVRTVLQVPEGLHPGLEERIEHAYGVTEVHIVDVPAEDAAIPFALGEAAARLLAEGTLTGDVIGFTSWSTTLQEMATALDDQAPRSGVRHVVEMLGDLGAPHLQHAATRSTQRLAAVLGAEPVFLRTPGVLASPALREAALRDPHVCRALRLLDAVDVAFVGVGPPGLHSVLRSGDNFFTAEQISEVEALGAVGQLNQRLLDASGRCIRTPLDDLVVGVSLEQLRAAGRRVVVAGGASKHAAIAAAARGGWVDVLITDLRTARALLAGIGHDGNLPARAWAG